MSVNPCMQSQYILLLHTKNTIKSMLLQFSPIIFSSPLKTAFKYNQRYARITRMYSFIDLSCDTDSFGVALRREGVRCVFSGKIDEQTNKIYKKNFSEEPCNETEEEIQENDIPSHDILYANFPYQSVPVSNNHNESSNSREKLFCKILRIVTYHKPYFLFLKNVKNNLTTTDNEIVSHILKIKLEQIGYFVQCTPTHVSGTNMLQTQERIHLVCKQNNLKSPEQLSKSNNLKTVLSKPYFENMLEDMVGYISGVKKMSSN